MFHIKNRLIALLSILSITAICVLTGCTNSDNDILSAEQLSSLKSVDLSLEAEQDFINDDVLRAMEFSLGSEGGFQSLTHSELTVPVHIYLRSTATEQPISVGTLSLNRTKSGERNLGLKLGTLALASSTDLTKGEWYIMGIIGGSRSGTQVNFSPSTSISTEIKAANQKVKLDLPFVSQWVKIDIKPNGNSNVRLTISERLRFKPQGAVIRATAQNSSDTDYDIKGYKLESNTASFAAHLDPGKTGLNPKTTPIVLEASTSATSVSGTFTQIQNLGSKSNLNYFLVWAAPLATQPEKKLTKFYLVTKNNSELKVYESAKEIKNGYLLRLSGGVESEAKLPLEMMAEYNLAGPGVFATNNDGVRQIDNDIAVSDWMYSIWHPGITASDRGISAIFQEKHLPVEMPSGYRIPTMEDWHAIFTDDFNSKIWGLPGADFEETYDGTQYVSRSAAMIPNYGVASFNTYRDLGAARSSIFDSAAGVAIRFEDKENSNNEMRSAWLYEFLIRTDIRTIYNDSDNPDIGPMMIKVVAIKDKKSTLQDIRNPNYWTEAIKSGKAVVRYLPYLISHYAHSFDSPHHATTYYSTSGDPHFNIVLNNSGPIYHMGTDGGYITYDWGMIRPFKIN